MHSYRRGGRKIWVCAGAAVVSASVWIGAALADRSGPDRLPAEQAPRASKRRPFSGSIRIRQEGGTLFCDFRVSRGKVVSGYCGHRGLDRVMYEIVGGWYDGERLTLLYQSPGENLNDPYFAHVNQFRRTRDGFRVEHTLFGFGKTEASGIVYRPYVIDRMDEAGGAGGDAGNRGTDRDRDE